MNDSVRAQYEAYPYPARDPRDEAKRLLTGSPSHLDELNHYVFGGRLDFSAPFRALVAGGGTGDGLIMLAQQCADAGVPAQIVYLDLSQASRATAEARAAARGLTSILFVTGSLLDLAAVAPGPYDYIDCCGVLHHLPDPSAGLAALAGQLAPGGGMGLMLYGPYGRTGVYPLQSALRRMAGDLDPAARVALARRLLASLPDIRCCRTTRTAMRGFTTCCCTARTGRSPWTRSLAWSPAPALRFPLSCHRCAMTRPPIWAMAACGPD